MFIFTFSFCNLAENLQQASLFYCHDRFLEVKIILKVRLTYSIQPRVILVPFHMCAYNKILYKELMPGTYRKPAR